MRAFIFVGFLLVAAGLASWSLLRTNNTAAEDSPIPQPRVYAGEVAEPMDIDLRPRHLHDERWVVVIEIVAAAEQRFSVAVHDHYAGAEGDFLQFRRAREEILHDLEGALSILNEMLVVCANSKTSSLKIRQQIARADKLATDIQLDLRH
jgi:hypothetical protein